MSIKLSGNLELWKIYYNLILYYVNMDSSCFLKLIILKTVFQRVDMLL